jgi:exodeoxyribonuclease-5
VHDLLQAAGIEAGYDEATGKQYFRRDVKEDNKFDRFDLVVVDEASMISEEMWRLLTDQVANLYTSTQILFVGDVAQLPPVNERESKCFTEILSSSSLTEVVRYGGSIGVLAESLRNRLDYVRFPPFVTDTNDDRTEGTFVLSPSQWEQSLLKAFSSDAYKRDSDYVRALAYTNKRVDSLNQKVRAQLYGDAAPRFTVNERLMANAPVYIKDSVVLENSAECEVLDVREGRSGSWTVWYLQVKTDDDRIKTLEVLHESERVRFARQLKEYSDSKRWREFWELKQIFADVSYAYAITVHKSQGSTFQNVFVDIGNISTNRNIRERNQLAYVGCTRAANRLFICQ